MARLTFGIGVAPYYHWPTLDAMADVAQTADRLGYDSISLPDHIAVPDTDVRPRSGDTWHDIFALGTFLATSVVTSRLVWTARRRAGCVAHERRGGGMGRLDDQVIIVTGGTGGIGRAFVPEIG